LNEVKDVNAKLRIATTENKTENDIQSEVVDLNDDNADDEKNNAGAPVFQAPCRPSSNQRRGVHKIIMQTIFKKPDLHQKEREAYLNDLNARILTKERELESITFSTRETKKNLEETLRLSSAAIHKQIAEIDNVLKLKQAERIELEKPISNRTKALDERAISLDEKSKALDEMTQKGF